MRPDTSDWRNDRNYDYLDTLPIEGIAWECLRRFVPYQDHYGRLAARRSQNLPLAEEAQQRWGLRFRRPAEPVLSRATSAVVTGKRSGRSLADPTPRLSSPQLYFVRRPIRRGA
jgi:hypothetical protein